MKRSMTSRRSLLLVLLVLGGALRLTLAEDWLHFRGTDSSGVARGEQPPLEWNEEKKQNLAWKAALPGRGLSSPLVVGERIYLTASGGTHDDRLYVLCFEASTGKRLWMREFWATGSTQCHPKMCMATPTPASDGRRIFAFYSSNDLFCLDLDGNLLWLRGLTHDYPNASNSVGMSSSPLVVGGTVIVQVENDSESFAAGIDVVTGRNLWKLPRLAKVNWSSPVSAPDPRDPSRRIVLLQNSASASAHDPATGETLWKYPVGAGAIPSMTVADGVVYLSAEGLTALQPSPGGGQPHVLWKSRRLRLSTPSATIADGRAYVLSGSILKCAATKTGELLWQLRLEGPFAATPIVSGDHLLTINEKGLAQIVKLGDKQGEIVAKNDLNATILCTPAISRGAMYVRSDEHFWKIARR